MKELILRFLPVVDLIFLPFVYIAAFVLKMLRRIGVYRLKKSKKALMKIGIFPIVDHYYEPQFKYDKTTENLSKNRKLSGIDWNTKEQIKLLAKFTFAQELANTPQKKSNAFEFYLNNGEFESGDAEYWYQIIRFIKPKRIYEIGSGYSTLMAIKAIRENQVQESSYKCQHICIEPYERPWLEKTGVTIIRKKVEDLDLSYFSELEQNDILFIDSSHIIRPGGDVLFEYLELLPNLNKGVIVHIHDIFSPMNYPKKWLEDYVLFWNEQYLLEAFLSNNNSWKIIGSLNFLQHNYHKELKAVLPFLAKDSEPGSFYIQKIS